MSLQTYLLDTGVLGGGDVDQLIDGVLGQSKGVLVVTVTTCLIVVVSILASSLSSVPPTQTLKPTGGGVHSGPGGGGGLDLLVFGLISFY